MDYLLCGNCQYRDCIGDWHYCMVYGLPILAMIVEECNKFDLKGGEIDE